MQTGQNYELEMEGELEGEFEDELEVEGEVEGELEWELEAEGEGEIEGELEWELEGEDEGEEFFRRLRRLASRAAPILRRVARVAAPMVGTAVGGPLGGMIARAAASQLEGEVEFEVEGEFEDEIEGEFEDEAMAPMTSNQALAEFMAAVASTAQTEAMVGAATVISLSPRDRRILRRVLPHLVRGTAVLTRILRRRRSTRNAVRVVPTIVSRTARTLARRASAGQPVTRRAAARAMATQTRNVLGRPRASASALQRNVRATRAVARNSGRPQRPSSYRRGRSSAPVIG
jgi:hypothetical protein